MVQERDSHGVEDSDGDAHEELREEEQEDSAQERFCGGVTSAGLFADKETQFFRCKGEDDWLVC